VPKTLVIVAGNARHGKDSISDMLAEMIPHSRRDAFADPMKLCVHLKTGIPMDILNGPTEVKDDPRFGRYGKSPRELTIIEGQLAREHIADTVWIDALVMRFKRSGEHVTIVSDCRYPKDEGTRIRENLGKDVEVLLVLVRRPDVAVKRGSPTEDLIADADESDFDYVVRNVGDLDELKLKARQLADTVVLRAKTGKKNPKGWIVQCPNGDRHREPYALKGEAETYAKDLTQPCGACGATTPHSLLATTTNLIERP
jgi:hypothetical protein